MAFELFKFKGGKGQFSFPTVTLQASGGLGLNDKAYEAIGAPKFVQLYYDGDAMHVGIKATDEDDSYGFPVRESGETSFTVSARSFYMYYGITLDATSRFRAALEGDMIVVNLRDPILKRRSRKKGHESPASNGPNAARSGPSSVERAEKQ